MLGKGVTLLQISHPFAQQHSNQISIFYDWIFMNLSYYQEIFFFIIISFDIR